MLLEQELASIIKFALDNSGNPAPYYYTVPEGFTVPAAYFPAPEISSGGDTFSTYALEYVWFIKFFHSTTQAAHTLALNALTAIKANRNLIPLINTDGEKTGEAIRLNDPELSAVDSGAVQLKIEWTSRRPYNAEEALKMQTFDVNYMSAMPYEQAIEQYTAALPQNQKTQGGNL